MSQMQRAVNPLKRVAGLQFFRQLGSGRQFHYYPNFSVYGLLAVWQQEADAERFFRSNPTFASFAERSQEYWTLYLENYQAHGRWSGQQPFEAVAASPPQKQPVVVLTRATINPLRLRSFWRQALQINQRFSEHHDCYFSLGVGEWPVVQQATFSLWKNAESMKQFAYRSELHKQAVRRTRQHGWFSEDMFARFIPTKSTGSWHGIDPLHNALAAHS